MLNNPQFAFSLSKSGTHEVDNKTLSESWKIFLTGEHSLDAERTTSAARREWWEGSLASNWSRSLQGELVAQQDNLCIGEQRDTEGSIALLQGEPGAPPTVDQSC